MKILVGITFSLLLLVGCGNPDSQTSQGDSVLSDPDSAIANTNRNDINQSCCFQSEKDFLPFFPDSCGDFIGQFDRTVQMKCPADSMKQSASTKTYVNSKGEIVAVTITDYCAVPDILRTDYALKFEEYKGMGRSEFNEFEVPGSHNGFAHYSQDIDLAVLCVVVDRRFEVEIVEMQCRNTKNVLAVYEKLPLQQLAGFKK